METIDKNADLRNRAAPLEIGPDEFRALGYNLVDQIASFLGSMPEGPVTAGERPRAVRQVLGKAGLPEQGAPPRELLDEAARLLFEHSLFNGHPRFLGFI